MKRNLSEIKYFETYYFANVIKNVLDNPFPYLRGLDDFFGENNRLSFIEPFPKISRLHDFIYWSIDTIVCEDIGDIERIQSGGKLWIDLALKHYGMADDDFVTYLSRINTKIEDAIDDDVFEYCQELRSGEQYDDLLGMMSDEIFFILFLNKQLLQKFNEMASTVILDCGLDFGAAVFNKYFKKDGVLKRVNIPSWVQKAVFHRDRGICSGCLMDLTGVISVGNTKNFDHIVPLEEGGGK